MPRPSEAQEREFWQACYVSALRALCNNPTKHVIDGSRLDTPNDVARASAVIADEAREQWCLRFGAAEHASGEAG